MEEKERQRETQVVIEINRQIRRKHIKRDEQAEAEREINHKTGIEKEGRKGKRNGDIREQQEEKWRQKHGKHRMRESFKERKGYKGRERERERETLCRKLKR